MSAFPSQWKTLKNSILFEKHKLLIPYDVSTFVEKILMLNTDKQICVKNKSWNV